MRSNHENQRGVHHESGGIDPRSDPLFYAAQRTPSQRQIVLSTATSWKSKCLRRTTLGITSEPGIHRFPHRFYCPRTRYVNTRSCLAPPWIWVPTLITICMVDLFDVTEMHAVYEVWVDVTKGRGNADTHGDDDGKYTTQGERPRRQLSGSTPAKRGTRYRTARRG